MRKIISIICLIFIVSASILPVYADESRIIVSFEEYSGIAFKDLSVKSTTNELVFFAYGSGYSESYFYAIAIEASGDYSFISYQDGSRLRIYSNSGSVSYSTTCYFYNTTDEIWVMQSSRSYTNTISERTYSDIWVSDSNYSFKLKKSTVDIDRQVNGSSLGVFFANYTLDNATSDTGTDSTGIINSIVTWFAKAFDDLKDFFTSLFEPIFKHFEEQGLIFENSVGRLVLFIENLINGLGQITLVPITNFIESLSTGAISIWLSLFDLPMISDFLLAAIVVSIVGGLFTLLISL